MALVPRVGMGTVYLGHPSSGGAFCGSEKDLKTVEANLDKVIVAPTNVSGLLKKAEDVYAKAAITPFGNGFAGAPVVAPDEQNKKAGELSWNDLETMLSGFAFDAVRNQSKESEECYFTVWKYAMDQGFAFGSGMGTNHHYGYQVRKIYTTAWLMRDRIAVLRCRLTLSVHCRSGLPCRKHAALVRR